MKSTSLLTEKRFGPFCGVQFLGAFNDNLFKNSFVFAYLFAMPESQQGLINNLSTAIFIAPFFIFSTLAGQLAEKLEKAKLIRQIKFAEILAMVLAAAGFALQSLPILLAGLFFMGLQSTFFSPVKYSLLPQVLDEDELVPGNAIVEATTFVAIILGMICAIVIVKYSSAAISAGIILTALVGWAASWAIPRAEPNCPDLKINHNVISETKSLFQRARQNHSVYLSILGISWFWLFGAVLLTQVPTYSKFILGGDREVAFAVLATFVFSISIGSFLAEWLSRGGIELALVPLGAFAMTVFSIGLGIQEPYSGAELLSLGEFLAKGVPWGVLACFVGLGVAAAFFSIPIYALIQRRSPRQELARIIAANNIMNALFMAIGSVFVAIMYGVGASTGMIFVTIGIMNLAVSIYVFWQVPEFLLRFMGWILASNIYRIRYEGRENVPLEGAAVLIANHVTYIDWLILTACSRRPIRFVMHKSIFKIPGLNFLFRLAGAIPIASAKEDPATKERAFEKIEAALRDDELICIFPEGTLTKDGELNTFRAGVEQIIKTTPVPVIPISMHGLWGSYFSREGGRAMIKVPKPTWRRIFVRVDRPYERFVSAPELQEHVANMLTDSES